MVTADFLGERRINPNNSECRSGEERDLNHCPFEATVSTDLAVDFSRVPGGDDAQIPSRVNRDEVESYSPIFGGRMVGRV